MPNREPVSILVVEDQADHAVTLMDLVTTAKLTALHFDFRFKHVDTFSAAQRELNHSEYDIIVLDLHLPNGAGTNLIRQIRLLAPPERTAILVMTGYKDEDEEIAARKALCNAYVEKGKTSPTEILFIIRDLAFWTVGCRETRKSKALAGMKRVKDKIDETVKVCETMVVHGHKH